ncbi:MAG: exo-alpha-sialidase, partial [Calditrichaeota bacterium]|nr:exo-alpha-sialidase [Calditrichota bacterium]
GEIPAQSGPVYSPEALDALGNNNAGASGTGNFTQSETSILAFGNTVILGFNDAGSNAGGANKFTGWSYSFDGGATFTDGGTLPTNAGGDAGDPVLARNETTGRIYYSTLGFSISTIQVFRSDDNGVTWSAPVNGTPGGSSEDKQWMAVDNFPGPGNGNVYLISRRFGSGPGIYMFRSTDHGNTFGPNLGVQIVSGQ